MVSCYRAKRLLLFCSSICPLRPPKSLWHKAFWSRQRTARSSGSNSLLFFLIIRHVGERPEFEFRLPAREPRPPQIGRRGGLYQRGGDHGFYLCECPL